MTGMDTRIGYPNEHLAPGTPDAMASPMYATGIGLVIQGIERYLREKVRDDVKIPEKARVQAQDKELREEFAEKEQKIEKKPRSNGFLKRIQDWFEGDEL
jgi:cell division protein FtsA